MNYLCFLNLYGSSTVDIDRILNFTFLDGNSSRHETHIIMDIFFDEAEVRQTQGHMHMQMHAQPEM